jgi:hypothetical protein
VRLEDLGLVGNCPFLDAAGAHGGDRLRDCRTVGGVLATLMRLFGLFDAGPGAPRRLPPGPAEVSQALAWLARVGP